jgi:Skp family chaperone for outer membrane proteins
MKNLGFIFIMTFFLMTLVCSLKAQAGEIYTYTDKDGNTVISNTPIPEKYEKKAKKIESYRRDSPEEIQRYETERKANIQRQEAETRQKQQSNSAQEEARNQNNQRKAQQQKQPQEQQDELTCYNIKEDCVVHVSGMVGHMGSCYATRICKDKYGHTVSSKRIRI